MHDNGMPLAGDIDFSCIRPRAIDSSGVTPPENSEIRKIAEDVFDAAKYAFANAAANPEMQVPANSLEADFQQAMAKMQPEKLAGVQKRASQMVSFPKASRSEIFGRYGEMDSKGFMAAGGFAMVQEAVGELAINTKLLGVQPATLPLMPNAKPTVTKDGLLLPTASLPADTDQLARDLHESEDSAAQSGVYNAEKLADIWGPVYQGDPFAEQYASSAEFMPQAVTDNLGLYITRVKCVDETNPEFWGSDEIALAGVSVDETGDTKKIAERYIGGGFDDGDSKSYSPHWRYEGFSLREGNVWPKHYSVSLILAEKDHGGLSDALNTVWVRVRDRVKAAIKKVVKKFIEVLLGSEIAKAISEAVAWIVDKLVGWIISAFKDDIFPPAIVKVSIPSFGARWNFANGNWGSIVSPRRRAHFSGHGGRYYVEYYWKMYA